MKTELAHPRALLPAKDVLMMVFRLPTTADQEIDGMVRLQAEEISPYPAEKTSLSWEKVGEESGLSRVLMVLCALQKLEAFRSDFLKDHQREPDRIDVDLLAYWELIRNHSTFPEGQGTFVLVSTGPHLYLLCVDQQAPCLCRTLSGSGELSAGTIREELHWATLSLASSFPEVEMGDLQLWIDGESPDWAEEVLQHRNGSLHHLRDLPTLAEGLQQRNTQDGRLDLTPQKWKQEKQKRQSRRKNLGLLSVALGIWILLMAGLIGRNLVASSQLHRQQKQNRQYSEKVQKAASLAAKVRSLSQFTDPGESALHTLLRLAQALPRTGNLHVDTFRYQKEERAFCTGSVNGSIDAFHQFLETLSASTDLEVNRYELKKTPKGYTFQLDFRWKDWPTDPEEIP